MGFDCSCCKYFICFMAISMISVFSILPLPFFRYSVGMSLDKSAKQLFIRSRLLFSIIRCDIGSCWINQKRFVVIKNISVGYYLNSLDINTYSWHFVLFKTAILAIVLAARRSLEVQIPANKIMFKIRATSIVCIVTNNKKLSQVILYLCWTNVTFYFW